VKPPFSIGPDPRAEALMKMMSGKEYQERLKAITQQQVYKAAEYVLNSVQGKIPSTDEYKDYRESLQVAEVTGDKQATTYAVVGKSKKKRLKTMDPSKTLIYVKPKYRLAKTSPAIRILSQYSPWTVETIPFYPSPKEATLITRKVREKEVDKIAKRLKRTAKSTWKRQLAKVGVKLPKKPEVKIPKGTKAVPDMVFQALRLELGLGGVKAKPHWRPALHKLMSEELTRIGNSDAFLKAATIPTYQAWKNWPTKTNTKISANVAESMQPFMKRLGIKVRGGS